MCKNIMARIQNSLCNINFLIVLRSLRITFLLNFHNNNKHSHIYMFPPEKNMLNLWTRKPSCKIRFNEKGIKALRYYLSQV